MTDSNSTALDTFGKLLMSRVRDESFDQVWDIFRGRMRSGYERDLAEQYMAAKFTPEQQAVLERVVLEAIDAAIHHFLWMIEDESVRGRVQLLAVRGSTGEMVDLTKASAGLSAQPQREGGWEAEHSKYPAYQAKWFAAIAKQAMEENPPPP